MRRLRRASIPLYVEVTDLMRQRLVRGNWPPGHKLPTLEDLVEEFGVARVTVRQAMDVLSDEGLIVRQQGRGTFVAERPEDTRWLRLETSLEALSEVYEDTKPELLLICESVAAPPLQPKDGVPAPSYQFMRRVHRRNDVPYCIIDIYLDSRVFRLAPARFRNETVIPLLRNLRGVEIAKAVQTLTVGTADMEVAERLGIPVNSPVANVRRVFAGADGTVIYLGEVIYRGDFIHLEIDLKK